MVLLQGLGIDVLRALSGVRLWGCARCPWLHGTLQWGTDWASGNSPWVHLAISQGTAQPGSGHQDALGCPLCQKSPWEVTSWCDDTQKLLSWGWGWRLGLVDQTGWMGSESPGPVEGSLPMAVGLKVDGPFQPNPIHSMILWFPNPGWNSWKEESE